ncbi:MAG TPA: peroxidase-related enzyme [Puia sp.]|nr:peroxidase-related enzyme [Puia sp.]
MAYIQVEEGVPGIRSLFKFSPETGKPLCDLAEVLLRGPSPLSSGERELIAAFVSNRNSCMFCMNSHAAAARFLFDEEKQVVDDLLKDQTADSLSPKMKALLWIAGKVQINGKSVTADDIEYARQAGANDTDIHDTVLIAASFSMFNRYVDGLASYTPANEEAYIEMGKRMGQKGYHI